MQFIIPAVFVLAVVTGLVYLARKLSKSDVVSTPIHGAGGSGGTSTDNGKPSHPQDQV